uniref:Uncharacterized protein n=1 Tax=Arundo donax TaxID=35708 RepID=A0A0A9GYB9_ARUDO
MMIDDNMHYLFIFLLIFVFTFRGAFGGWEHDST